MIAALIMFAPLILCLLLLLAMYGYPYLQDIVCAYRIKKIHQDILKKKAEREALAEEQALQEWIYDIQANNYEIIHVFDELQ